MDATPAYLIIYGSTAVGLLYALYNFYEIRKINLKASPHVEQELGPGAHKEDHGAKIAEIGEIISRGASAFLMQEYKYLSVFIVCFAIIIFVTVEQTIGDFYTTVAFIIGALTSISCGFIGMKIAVYTNYRTCFVAQDSLAAAFSTAYRAGCVMGFSLVSIGLLMLHSLIAVYWGIIYTRLGNNSQNLPWLYETIAGFGLGGSAIALFARVGGGIYTKAADVGADLVGKIERDLPEDSPKNPATIADNVGDNVGDIAGMGADLFGSLAESTCAALVISSNFTDFQNSHNAMNYPLFISALGIFVCLITSFIATTLVKVDKDELIEATLKRQLLYSSILMTPALFGAAYATLPTNFHPLTDDPTSVTHPWHAGICSVVGLWCGLCIGYLTEYYTSHSHTPVREVARSCETGAATNIIYGLALGYLSTIIPVTLLAITSYVGHKLMGMYGVSLSALGMLSNLCIGLAIDAYGPISDNAGGIAEMSELHHDVRKRTDALDAAGNTTAAIGKGFAIGSACLVSLSLYGAYITRVSGVPTNWHGVNTASISLTNPLVFSGLLLGAMMPYAFSAFTMKSVGKAALQMVKEVRRQLQENPGIIRGESAPDYEKCVAISTKASLREMILPGALVILTPIVLGIVFGPKAVAGLLPGIVVSGVQMAISSSNTGGAWDNAKKYIESGQLIVAGEVKKKGTDEHRAAVIGDTVGDPLKDTSGPSLNILIKLSAILSLIFGEFFARYGLLVCAMGENISSAEC